MNEQIGPALLIDARNAIYRAVYAGLSDRSDRPKYHFCVLLLRQIAGWINIKRPSRVHIFWDAPRETVWRRSILATYKDRSTSNYVEGLAEHLAKTTAVAQDLFKFMGVRQYNKSCMEADDLIYAAASLMHPQRTFIISNDSDMQQIPFRFNSCTVYHPGDHVDLEVPELNPAYMKAMVGDTVDAIDGYRGIGPVKGKALLENPGKLQEYLAANGPKLYYRNLLLTDLSMCPKILHNTIYVQKVMAETVTWDKGEINNLINQHKINGLMQEFANLVVPFKSLI